MSRLRERTVLLALGGVVSSLAALAAAVILSRLLSKELYGTYRQAFFVYRFLLGILGLKVATSVLYFVPRAEAGERPTVVGQSLLVGAAGGTLIALIIAGGAGLFARGMGNAEIGRLLYWLAAFAIVDQVTLLVPNMLLAADRVGLVLGYDSLGSVVRAGAAVVPFALGMDIAHVFVVIVGCEAVVAAAGLVLVKTTVGVRLGGVRWSGVAAQISYCWPLLAQAVIAVVNVEFDRAVIAVAFDPERFAEYTNGAMQVPLVMIAIGSINRAILPDMSRLGRQNRTADMLALWRSAAVKGAGITFPTVAFFLLCPDYIMTILYGPRYLASAIPFAIYTAGLIARIAYFGAVFEALGRNRNQIVAAGVTLATNAALTLTLVYVGRGTVLAFAGPAIGTAVALVAHSLTMMALIARATGCPFGKVLPLRRLGIVALAGASAAAPAFALRLVPLSLYWKAGLMGCTFAAVYVAVAVRLQVISPDDIAFVKGVLKGIARRLRGGKAAP